MAEALLRHYAGDRFEAHSAGLEPKGVHPNTVRVLGEIGVDSAGQRSKHLDQYMGKVHFGYVITVCANAEDRCPAVFPGMGRRLHWAFDDPAAGTGTEAETLERFRQVRDQIGARLRDWLSEQETEKAGGCDAATEV